MPQSCYNVCSCTRYSKKRESFPLSSQKDNTEGSSILLVYPKMQEKGLKLIARPKEWTEHIFCSAVMLPQVAVSYLLLCMGTQWWYIIMLFIPVTQVKNRWRCVLLYNCRICVVLYRCNAHLCRAWRYFNIQLVISILGAWSPGDVVTIDLFFMWVSQGPAIVTL